MQKAPINKQLIGAFSNINRSRKEHDQVHISRENPPPKKIRLKTRSKKKSVPIRSLSAKIRV